MSNLKISIENGDMSTCKITVDDKPVFCETVDIHINYAECKATITIYDLSLKYDGPVEVRKVPKPVHSHEVLDELAAEAQKYHLGY